MIDARTARVVPAPDWLVIGALALCVASLPFEMPNRTIRFEIPTLTASLFLGVCLLRPRACFLHWVPGPLWGFLTYLFFVAATPALHGWVDAPGIRYSSVQVWLLLLQGMLFFWAAANVLRDRRAVTVVLWAFAVACVIRAGLPYLGIGRTAYEVWTGGVRITAFGQNANFAGKMLAAGVLVLLGLTYAAPRSPRGRWLALPAFGLLGVAIVDTGSRGALAALATGVLIFAALSTSTARGRVWPAVRNVLMATLVLGFLVNAAMRSTVMRGRLEATAETGTMAGREQLFPALIQMFVEKPLFGWGTRNNQYELAARAPFRDMEKRDSHNLVLEVLTTTGVAGGVPFLAAFAVCGVAAWRGRRSDHGALPVALFGLELVGAMSGNPIAAKLFWFVLAYAMAAALQARAVAPAFALQPAAPTPAPWSYAR